MNTQRALLLAALLATVLFSGCRVMETPSGFVSLDPEHSQAFYAVAANGNTVVVKVHENPDDGTLDFWKDSVLRELVETRGYSLVSTQAVTTSSGMKGVELLMTAPPQAGPYTYLMAIFVEPGGGFPLFPNKGRVVVAEAGGQNDAMKQDLPALRTAIKSLD